MSRDAQRSACYEAERHWFHGTLMNERQSFESLASQTREIEAAPEWQQLRRTPVTIGYNEGSRSFAQGSFLISYALAGTGRSTVCHEMAHVITPSDVGHDHEWRSAFVWVTRLAYGDDWADSLGAGFASSKLSFDVWPLERTTPVFPPHLFAASHGAPLFTTTTNTPNRAIAL